MTGKTVLISDLKAEIGPHKILDLEKVVDRASIDRSPNLQQALQTNRLRLVKHSVIKTKKQVVREEVKIIEKTIEREKIDEVRLASLIRSVLHEESINNKDIEDRVHKAIGGNLKEIVSDIRKEIQSGFSKVRVAGPAEKTIVEESIVDPVKLAELQQNAIRKISEGIEISDTKKPKSIRLVNKKLDDLASEL